MNKKDLNEAFDKEFNNLVVSTELKNKTLNAIHTQKKLNSPHLPYLRNFAAVFIVSLICLSIYLARNNSNENNITFDKSATNSEGILEETEELNSAIPELSKTITTEKTSPPSEFGTLNTTLSTDETSIEAPTLYSSGASTLSNALQKKSVSSTDNTRTEALTALSEEDFIKAHPNAEKIDNGYIIHENETETVYIFKDKVLENIIIID